MQDLNNFLPLEDDKDIYEINKHWTGNYPMKCCLNQVIDIKTLS